MTTQESTTNRSTTSTTTPPLPFSVHTMAIHTFVPMLRTLSDVIIAKGIEHARAKKINFTDLMNARLAPDMFPLTTQVQLACYHARELAARLTGGPLPEHEESGVDKTLDALKARLTSTIEHLEHIPPSAFDGAADRHISIPLGFVGTLEMKGHQFLRDWSLPHFYFHVVTAYDILRHEGVVLGKEDYLSHIGSAIRPPDAAKH